MFDSYLKLLFEITKRGDAREESYYSTLEDLIHSLAKHFDKAKVQVATLPKKTLIITVLGKTIDIQSELDPLFDAVEKNILQIEL